MEITLNRLAILTVFHLLRPHSRLALTFALDTPQLRCAAANVTWPTPDKKSVIHVTEGALQTVHFEINSQCHDDVNTFVIDIERFDGYQTHDWLPLCTVGPARSPRNCRCQRSGSGRLSCQTVVQFQRWMSAYRLSERNGRLVSTSFAISFTDPNSEEHSGFTTSSTDVTETSSMQHHSASLYADPTAALASGPTDMWVITITTTVVVLATVVLVTVVVVVVKWNCRKQHHVTVQLQVERGVIVRHIQNGPPPIGPLPSPPLCCRSSQDPVPNPVLNRPRENAYEDLVGYVPTTQPLTSGLYLDPTLDQPSSSLSTVTGVVRESAAICEQPPSPERGTQITAHNQDHVDSQGISSRQPGSRLTEPRFGAVVESCFPHETQIQQHESPQHVYTMLKQRIADPSLEASIQC